MKKVYTAAKHSYGSEFTEILNSYEELKKAIVNHELGKYDFDLRKTISPPFSEENYIKALEQGIYIPCEIELHEDEEIVFSEYDGSSGFKIEKIDKTMLSNIKKLD